MIIIQVIYWVIFMYGLLSLIQDIATEFTYKKYNKNIKVFVCVNDFKNEIENFEKEISKVKWQFKNIGINIVNFDENLSDEEVENFFEESSIGIFSKEEFYEYVKNCSNM